ncbi:MAG: ABC-F family ATP-binding cassette domain-containing protein [Deltaproteobacteria bacterium]|nr:ABC-F family ATP-binding cassette domain-containing protein [Deltaproteobacteria bacterium]
MINVENLTKSYDREVLFDNVSFKLNPKEKIGLLGRNGHGKTTLFRLITGKISPDSGIIIIPKYYRIGYVRQELEFTKDTVLAEGMTGLREDEKNHHWKVEEILSGLGFSKEDLNRHPVEFSGGFQVRLNLAKVLVSEPDLLLLDEPTNYLDITSIRWVERFLIRWPRELMLITHDRSLMDKVITHAMGVHRRKIRKLAGNTEKYYTQLAQDEEVYEKTRLNDERRRKEIKLFISRFRAKARLANMVQSRVKTLSKMENKEKLESLKTLDFSFRSSPFAKKQVMNVRNVSFSYDPREPLIKNFNFSANARERICVVGKNGKGKTTLLRLLSGVLKPQNGEIALHPAVKQGYFEQSNVKNIDGSRTIEEEILFSHPDVDRQQARNICGAMMFEGDSALKKIDVLSGGEKSRVILGKLLVTPLNLLLLDEPTNHLDMESCDAMLAAIDSFEGTVIMVTHNEMFLHALAERLIVFQNHRVDVFEGSYQRFLEKDGWSDETGTSEGDLNGADPDKESHFKLTKKEKRRIRSKFVAERSRALKPLEQQILRIENRIEKHENEIDELNTDLLTASQAGDGKNIGVLSRSIHSCRSAIDNLFEELEHSTIALEEQKTIFGKKLEQLESDI